MAREKRKRVWMMVQVSVPAAVTAAEARREVRTLVNEQCNYMLDEGDVKALRVVPVPTSKKG